MHATDWLSFSFSFAVVLALLGALLYGLKRLQNGNLLGMPQRRIRVLESASIAPRQKLVLVRVKDQDLLLGVTVQQINTLASFPVGSGDASADAADAADAADTVDAQGNNHLAPLAHKLAELLKSVKDKPADSPKQPNAGDDKA